MIGQWIDGLTDEQKDRIVRGKAWKRLSAAEDYGPLTPRCVLQHAYTIEGYWEVGGAADQNLKVAFRFDQLVDRFGLDRIVRAVKLRAAATMSSEVERAEGAVVTP